MDRETDDRSEVRILLLPDGVTVGMKPGENLYSGLVSRGHFIPGPCQGRGLCGRCLVRLAPIPPLAPLDRAHLTAPELAHGLRLACAHRVDGLQEVDVVVPPTEAPISVTGGQTLPSDSPDRVLPTTHVGLDAAGERRRRALPVAFPTRCAAVVDIGTTTLTVQLLDPDVPAILGTAVATNPQAIHGDDILSRISFASHPGGLELLRKLLVAEINRLLAVLLASDGINAPVRKMTVAANPVMAALFLGLDPAPLARPPYRLALPATVTGRSVPGLAVDEKALVNLVPPLGGYVGGDITAGLVHLGPARTLSRLFLDLGTNGEVVLEHHGRLLALSTAAGSALEGGRISHGMRALPGAIERVTLAPDLAYATIGGLTPAGLCGSGLLDLLGGLVEAGLILPDGRLINQLEAAQHPRSSLVSRLTERQGERGFAVTAEIVFTQSDVRELQLAKGAIRAGVELLLDHAGLKAKEVEQVVVGGNFGYHIREADLLAIGMFPAGWRGRLRFAGNTALDGARDILLSGEKALRAATLPELVELLDPAADPGFQERFLTALPFPSPY